MVDKQIFGKKTIVLLPNDKRTWFPITDLPFISDFYPRALSNFTVSSANSDPN